MANFLNRLFKGATEKRNISVSPDTGVTITGIQDYDFGVSVSVASAMKFTAWYGGCKLIADNVASLPIHVHKFSKGKWIEDTSSSAYRLLNIAPNHFQTPYEFKHFIAWTRLNWGKAFALIIRDAGARPIEIIPLNPDWVTLRISKSNLLFQVSASDEFYSEYDGIYLAENMLYFKGITNDGYTALSPVEWNAAAIGEGLAAQKFAAEYYKKGGNMKGVITNDRILAPEELDRFKKHFSDSARNYGTPVLDAGYKYQQLSINPVVAQLLAEKTFSIDDIARILSIPPHLLMELSHATFSNIEQENIEFVTMTLRPFCESMEAELDMKLFLTKDLGKFQIDFDLDGMLRGDTTARSAFYHQMLQDCVMTPNEVRDKEHLERQEGLDFYMKPLNMETIKITDATTSEEQTTNGK